MSEEPKVEPSMADKLAQLRLRVAARAEEQRKADEEKLAEAQRIYAERAAAAGVDPASGARYASAPEVGGLGTIPLPKSWFGAEQEALVRALPEEDVQAFADRMNDLCAARAEGDIKQASARLQNLLLDKPGITTLINPQIMHAFVEKMQAYRRVTFRNSMVKKESRAGKDAARESAEALLGLLD